MKNNKNLITRKLILLAINTIPKNNGIPNKGFPVDILKSLRPLINMMVISANSIAKNIKKTPTLCLGKHAFPEPKRVMETKIKIMETYRYAEDINVAIKNNKQATNKSNNLLLVFKT